MRLDRYVSMSAGVPRRKAGGIIRRGRVTVNGRRCTDPRTRIAVSSDVVGLDGDPLRQPGHLTLMMNKPTGCISATRSQIHETVLDHVPEALRHSKLAPVGRLDKDTTGLLLLTTDGGLSHKLTHPKRKVQKVYIASLKSPLVEDAVERFANGITLADGTVCRPATLRVLDPLQVEVTLTEGRFHQVKRMLGVVDGHVTSLRRVRVGPIELDRSLELGTVRRLSAEELDMLSQQLSLAEPAADAP
ncbi:MAG TPA: 16S rRNA pseudouridine(516) synthase, partial [Myxococcales bacterium]|nr:16S rRNA pseudouridine(516) synthase [Myxococcales bacterium]